jgi:hypothetical protein
MARRRRTEVGPGEYRNVFQGSFVTRVGDLGSSVGYYKQIAPNPSSKAARKPTACHILVIHN